MKNIIKLGMLAALATVSVHATTVSFTTPQGSTASISNGGVSLTGYIWDDPNTTWITRTVASDGTGVGVVGFAGLTTSTEGTWVEFILLDFGGTATGNVKVDSLVLNYPTNNPGTSTPQNPYFKYAWVSGVPSGPTPNAGDDPYTTNIGVFTNYVTLGTNGGTDDLFTFSSVPGTGRYLLLGAINGSLNSTNYFQVNSVSYTSVPEGASTLALMGAALATLGFTTRRRKA